MLTEFTVKRSNWTGNPDLNGVSCLLNKHGNLCCLGFYCRQAGVPDNELLNKLYPHDIKECEKFPEFVIEDDDDGYGPYCTYTELSKSASIINDSDSLTLKAKESQLIELFASHGITLTFID